MRDQYKLLAEMYNVVKENEASPEQQAAFQAYMAKHKEYRNKYQREDEVEIGGEVYAVYFNVSYDSRVIDHIARTGHYGPRGRDVYADVPQITSDDSVLVLRYDEATGQDQEVTDPNIIETVVEILNSKLAQEQDNVRYGREI